MKCLYLNRLEKEGREGLERQLWEQQGGKCLITTVHDRRCGVEFIAAGEHQKGLTNA